MEWKVRDVYCQYVRSKCLTTCCDDMKPSGGFCAIGDGEGGKEVVSGGDLTLEWKG